MRDPVSSQACGISVSFRSGMSAKSDMRGAIDAGVPVGVVIGQLTTAQIVMVLPRYMDEGGKVFADSGAFSCFMTGENMDWSDVMSRYTTLTEMTDSPENLWVVSPDKIGDQVVTLELLREWKTKIVALIDTGCNVIIPIQCGALPGQVMIDMVAGILGTRNWVAGIPSNKAAMSIEECAQLHHDRFHILGRVQYDQEQQERIAALRYCNPEAMLTADANWLRSRLQTVRDMTEEESSARHAARKDGRHCPLDHPRAIAVKRAILGDGTWGSAVF